MAEQARDNNFGAVTFVEKVADKAGKGASKSTF